MSEEEKNTEENEETPEEQTAESEALEEVDEDELRDKIAEETGLDPDSDKDVLDKIVAREKSQRESFAKLVKQKRKWRDQAQKASKKLTGTPEAGKTQTKETFTREEAEQMFNEKLEARDLERLGLPEDLKTEVRDLAKLKGISIGEAAQLPYIQTRKAEIEREQRVLDATPRRSRKGSHAASIDVSKPLDINDFRTADGNVDTKAWKEAQAARAKHLQDKKSA